MMTIDNSPASPRFGRLYVVWNANSPNGIDLMVSQCDTRPGGVLNPANCDNADSWSPAVAVTKTRGSYIYGDVAAAPDGKVYVTWWNFSSVNAIQGAVCLPSATCTSAGGWSGAANIATLNAFGGAPLPFKCPIVAQPGGRDAPAPSVDVDRSGGANDNRVYVTWGDLRAGSGTTRCDGKAPKTTHLTWDSFVASASGTLPGAVPAQPSATVGTRLLTDGEGGGQPNSDDWFAALAVDQTTGQAWADFYSTRDDATRRTTQFYARSVTPSGGGHALGALTRVSSAASDYSANPCCQFGNDYGDYTGIDAAFGIAIPVWSGKQATSPGPDGEAFVFVDVPATTPDTVIVSGPPEGGATSAPTFSFTATEDFSTFECRVDGEAFAECASPTTLTGLADGPHTFAVRAIDPQNNVDPTPATRSFTLDTTPPETTITGGPAEGTAIGTATPGFAFSSPETTATFECSVDGAGFAACSSPLTTAPLDDGPHTIAVRALDAVGNADASPATRSFTVDTVAPDTAITSGPADGSTVSRLTASFGLAASETDATLECRIDSGAFAPCASPFATAGLAQGSHSFAARAVDRAGNTDATPATRDFTALLPPRFSARRVRSARVTARRVVTLAQPRMSCPTGPVSCRLTTTARVGSSRRTVGAGRTATPQLRLTRSAFRTLQRRGRLRVRVVITARRGGLQRRVQASVVLLAPR
jgi:hypothetical protein